MHKNLLLMTLVLVLSIVCIVFFVQVNPSCQLMLIDLFCSCFWPIYRMGVTIGWFWVLIWWRYIWKMGIPV